VIAATSLFVAVLTAAAPVPKEVDTPASDAPVVAPTGPAPRIMFLKPDQEGKIWVTAMRPNPNAQIINNAQGGNPGGRAQGFVPIMATRVELKDLRELKASTAGGKQLETSDALKRLAKGGYILVPADGKAISPGYAKLFKEDTLVLTSPDFGGANSATGGAANFTLPAIQPAPRAVPAPQKQ
jgi:hypothetical protein